MSGPAAGAGTAPVSGVEQIAAAFRGGSRRAALMPYLMGGFPDLDASRRIGEACVDAGADLLEVGVPFSDPLADGPVIHAAGSQALSSGATVASVLALAGELAARVPVTLMCYANPILARGPARFAGELAGAGVSGLIVPDLPYEEATELLGLCDEAGVALVPLVAPTTPEQRLAEIGRRARGFLYTVSVTGTTGERPELSQSFAAAVARAASHTRVPVAVGFGISTPELARAAADGGADGVIVGSRLVRAAAEAAQRGEDPARAVAEVVAGMADALAA